jgi:hypothetical protein
MAWKMNFNPNFKEDVMKAAEEKLNIAVAPAKAVLVTDKEALQMLERGEKLSNEWLDNLSQRGLIEVKDVTSNSTPPGQRDLLFTFITEKGRKVLKN